MEKRVFKNFIYNLLLKFFMSAAPLITSPYLARILHPEGIGVFSYTSTIAAAFALFAGLGTATYGQREIAYRQDNLSLRSKTFFEIFLLRVLTTLPVLAAYLWISFVYTEYSKYLLILSIMVFSGILDISWYYLGMEDFGKIVIRDVFVKLAQIACIFLLVKTESDLWIFVAINAVSTLLSYMLYFVKIRNYLDFSAWREVELKSLHPHLIGSLSFFIPALSVELYSHFDKIMLGVLLESTVENGYYEQARKIVAAMIPVLVSLNTVLLSRIANHYAKGEKKEIIFWYRTSFNVILMLVFPIMLGMWMVSDNFVLWFFGPDFAKVSLLLKISCPMILFMCVGNFVGVQYLSPTGQQRKMTYAYASAAVTNFILNLILIPRLMAVGALLASVCAEVISCGLQVYFLKKGEYNFTLFKDAWKYLLATVIMGAVISAFNYLIPLQGAGLTFADIGVGMLSYMIVLLLVKEPVLAIAQAYYKKKRAES